MSAILASELPPSKTLLYRGSSAKMTETTMHSIGGAILTAINS